MGKNDFDIDFDFNEDYDFDPKAFLGTEEYDENMDPDAFSDEELGLTSQKKASAPASEEEFDLDDDLDLDEFLNMGFDEETTEEEEPEEDLSEEAEETYDEDEEAESEEAEYSEILPHAAGEALPVSGAVWDQPLRGSQHPRLSRFPPESDGTD